LAHGIGQGIQRSLERLQIIVEARERALLIRELRLLLLHERQFVGLAGHRALNQSGHINSHPHFVAGAACLRP
jgi:hypothetical protein